MTNFMQEQVTPAERVADPRSGLDVFYPPKHNTAEVIGRIERLNADADALLKAVRNQS